MDYRTLLPGMPTKLNPFLLRLTTGERTLGWLWTVIATWLILWFVSINSICGDFQTGGVFSFICLPFFVPFSFLALAICMGIGVLTAAQLTVRETQSEQLALLRLTSISQDVIIWSLVLGTLHRARYWLAVIFGFFPYLLWLLCQRFTH